MSILRLFLSSPWNLTEEVPEEHLVLKKIIKIFFLVYAVSMAVVCAAAWVCTNTKETLQACRIIKTRMAEITVRIKRKIKKINPNSDAVTESGLENRIKSCRNQMSAKDL